MRLPVVGSRVLCGMCSAGVFLYAPGCPWREEGRARAPLMGPLYLLGHQLGGKSKYSLFSTQFLFPSKLSSHWGGWDGSVG